MPPVSSAADAPSDPALKALRVSESRYRRLFETAQDGILLLNAETARIEDVNPFLIGMLGYSRAEFLGKKLWEAGSFEDIAQSKEMFGVLQTQGHVRYKDLQLKTKSGAQIAVDFVGNTYDCEGTRVIQCNIRDIAERKADRENIQRHTQLYAALSQSNKAIVHSTSMEELFLQICRIAVQFGGMKMAWVGLIDPDTRMVRPAASFGDDTRYLKDVHILADADSPLGRGPTGTAVREGHPYWCQDFMNDPVTVPWRERAARAGWAASASLPLHRQGVVFGVFTLYSGEVDSFDESARDLLVGMAADISFALDNFARESQRKRAEEEIKLKNTILRTQQETSLDAILVVDENGHIISYNQRFIDMWRISPQLASLRLDAPLLQSVVGQVENPEKFADRVQYLYEHRDEKSREEIPLKDGRVIDRYSAPVTGADGEYYGRVWYFRDISEHKLAEDKIRESKNLLQLVVENAPTRIFWKDRDLRYLGCNTRFAIDAGYSSPGELIGKTDFEMGWKDQAELYRADDKEVLVSGAAKLDIEEPQTTPDGNTIWLRTSKVPLLDKENRIIGILGLYQDITERKQAEQALRTSEVRFKTMFMQAPFGIALIDSLSGHICEVNSRFAEIAGRTMEEMANIDWLQITHPDDVQADLDNMALLNAGKINGFRMEKRYLHRDGTTVWIDMTVTPLKVEDKTQPRHLCMIQDITERKESEARIRYLNRVYVMLSGINTLIVRVRDRDELFREACRVAVETGGFRMAMIAIVDRSAMSIVPVASSGKDEELMDAIKGLLSSGELASNTMVARAIREKAVVVSNDTQSDPRVLLGRQYAESGVRSLAILPLIVSDEVIGTISLYASEIDFFHEEELKLLTELAGDIAFAIDHIGKQERLDYLAYYDTLTGLANRRLFLDRVGQYIHSAVSGGHKLALLLIDLERFKNINDSLGRPAGDALLKQVAEWLTHNMGGGDLLARVDADHFAIVVPEVKHGGDLPKLFDQKAQAFLEHPFRLNDAVFRIAAKAGIAIFPDDGADADTLFRNAEAALKKAKTGGDRYLFYTQQMTEAVAAKLILENQLRQAIDNEEFVLHYQPKVDMLSGKVTGAEALIRWNDPRTGLVPPGQFIPVLEETGLINEVGRWALRKAIQDYLRWRAAGLPAVRIAVNVSALQLHNPGFVAEIEREIGIGAHAAEGLELEITESLIMADVKHSIATLQAIRAMGVSIAIDDFGTGFSSLSYLARLPVDTLKIDRSFVLEMNAPEGLALVSTIIILAHALKLKTVAEGVETGEQAGQLRSLGCDEMQGFLFSKPVPAEIF
ncbi:MAG TPA: EAL domain-containing protein, partial [Gallionella sp.]|nr:EAL domain-containing protein [Gallionella sp.]